MRLSGRLDRLEREWPGGCPECAGKMPLSFVDAYQGQTVSDPLPCGTCGKQTTLLIVIRPLPSREEIEAAGGVPEDVTLGEGWTPSACVDYRRAIQPLAPIGYEWRGAEHYSGPPLADIIREHGERPESEPPATPQGSP